MGFCTPTPRFKYQKREHLAACCWSKHFGHSHTCRILELPFTIAVKIVADLDSMLASDGCLRARSTFSPCGAPHFDSFNCVHRCTKPLFPDATCKQLCTWSQHTMSGWKRAFSLSKDELASSEPPGTVKLMGE